MYSVNVLVYDNNVIITTSRPIVADGCCACTTHAAIHNYTCIRVDWLSYGAFTHTRWDGMGWDVIGCAGNSM